MVRVQTRMRSAALAILFAVMATPAWAQVRMNIAQIDPSRLLTRQQVDAYVSVTGPNGNSVGGLGAQDFSMYEAQPGGPYLPVPFTLHEGAPAGEGLTFYLLVDNSGSMYDPVNPPSGAAGPTVPARGVSGAGSAPLVSPGTNAAGQAVGQESKIDAAEAAIRTFLNSVENPADKIGFASFNTLYTVETLPTRVRSAAEASLAKIQRPSANDAYTELYASLQAAANDLAGWKGRKVIILLTDGENFPYFVHTGKPSPQFGSEVVTSNDAIKALIREGISVFPIQFGQAPPDANLGQIARSTGGLVFDANDEGELAKVYLSVRKRVLAEYRLTYSPRMLPGERREVRVDYHGPGDTASASQYYFVGTLFGPPSGRLSLLFLLPFIFALAAWYLISRIRFLNRRTDANLEVIGGGPTKLFSLGEGRTVIDVAGSRQVTFTSEGNEPGDHEMEKEGQVTIIRDAKTGNVTVASSTPVMVNNRPTTRRLLRPGDVLRIGEKTVVFDDSSNEETPKK